LKGSGPIVDLGGRYLPDLRDKKVIGKKSTSALDTDAEMSNHLTSYSHGSMGNN